MIWVEQKAADILSREESRNESHKSTVPRFSALKLYHVAREPRFSRALPGSNPSYLAYELCDLEPLLKAMS